MEFLKIIAGLGTYFLMGVIIVAAIGAVTLRNLFHAALMLAAVLVGMAGIYIILHAEFLAMVQILIYVGAVMTLVVFAIMLTQKMTDASVRQNNRQSFPAFIAVVLFVVMLGGFFLKGPWAGSTANPASLERLGQSLMTQYVFPFEVVGIVLFAVLIGALVIARKERDHDITA